MSLILKLLSGSFGGWIIVISLLGSSFAGGVITYKALQLNQLRKEKLVAEKSAEERAKALELSKALETRLAAERAKRIEIEGKLRDELKSPAYNCVVPASGVQLLRDAVGTPAR